MLHGIKIILDGIEYEFEKNKMQALFILALERVGNSVPTLARHLGVTRAAISNWQLGKNRIIGDNLARLVRLAIKGL